EAASSKTRNQFKKEQILAAHKAMTQKFGTKNYTEEDLEYIENPTATEHQEIAMLSQMLNFADSVTEVINEMQRGIDYFQNRLDHHFNLDKNFRAVLSDNPYDINDNIYGDNNVASSDPTRENAHHGT